MTQNRDPKGGLHRLIDAYIENILDASDREIDEDISDSGGPSVDVDKIVDRAITLAGKSRLAAAREAMRKPQRVVPGFVSRLSIDEKKALLAKAAASVGALGGAFTLAARKETELSDEDLNAQIEALIQLGIQFDE